MKFCLRMYQRPEVAAPVRGVNALFARDGAPLAGGVHSGAGGTTTIIVRATGVVPSFR